MQKSVCEYLVSFSSESVKTSAGCFKKKVTLKVSHRPFEGLKTDFNELVQKIEGIKK
jgi:hypothetical protein